MNRLNLDKKITLRLDGVLVDRLQARAVRQRVPLSYILRNMVIRYLEGQTAETPSSVAGTRGVVAELPRR